MKTMNFDLKKGSSVDDGDFGGDAFAALGIGGEDEIDACGDATALMVLSVPGVATSEAGACVHEVSVGSDDAHLRVGFKADDGNGALVVGADGIWKGIDGCLVVLVGTTGGIGTERDEACGCSDEDLTRAALDGDVLDVVRGKGAVGSREVMDGLHAVVADEV